MPGIDTDHATLGADVNPVSAEVGVGRAEVTALLPEADVTRRGLEYGDQIMTLGGRSIASRNHLVNVLGIYPRGWRMPMEFRHNQVRKEVLVRLRGYQRLEVKKGGDTDPGDGDGGIGDPDGPGAKFYKAKAGFANYYFNELERDRVLKGFQKHGDFKTLTGEWAIDGTVSLIKSRAQSKAAINIKEIKDGAGTKTSVVLTIGAFPVFLEPLKEKDMNALKKPADSGGLMVALYVYRHLLTQGQKGFQDFDHGGIEPIYPPAPPAEEGKKEPSLSSRRVDAEVINARLGAFRIKLFFARDDQKLLAMEVRFAENEDPCEVYFSEYRAVNGRQLPHRVQVLYGNGTYGTFNLQSFDLKSGS